MDELESIEALQTDTCVESRKPRPQLVVRNVSARRKERRLAADRTGSE